MIVCLEPFTNILLPTLLSSTFSKKNDLMIILDVHLVSPISLIIENVEIHNRKEAFNWDFQFCLPVR